MTQMNAYVKQRFCPPCGRPKFHHWVRKIPWRRKWLLTTVFLTGKFHGQRSLAGYSPWGPKVSGTTEYLTLMHTYKTKPDSQI